MKRWYAVLILGVVVVGGLIFWQLTRSSSPLSVEKLPDVVDYNFHIRPILSDRCFKCHGPDANQRKAELRLDKEQGL